MNYRKSEVEQMAGGPVTEVKAAAVVDLYKNRVDGNVLECACHGVGETRELVKYWQRGNMIWMDDPTFGEPVRIEDLRYSADLGMYSALWDN